MPEHIALDKVESSLNELIETLRSNQQGFKELGHRLQNDRAKRFFLEEMQVRAEYAAELENELHRMGVHDVKTGTFYMSKARYLWGEMQAGLVGGQKALLSTAEKGEHAAKDVYSGVLKEDLPLPLREMLQRQLTHIQKTHDHIKTLHTCDSLGWK